MSGYDIQYLKKKKNKAKQTGSHLHLSWSRLTRLTLSYRCKYPCRKIHNYRREIKLHSKMENMLFHTHTKKQNYKEHNTKGNPLCYLKLPHATIFFFFFNHLKNRTLANLAFFSPVIIFVLFYLPPVIIFYFLFLLF